MHNIHATILHQLEIDHEQLTFRDGGRDERLTELHGKVIRYILNASHNDKTIGNRMGAGE